jgi:REP element-mobilizing transposase RayT
LRGGKELHWAKLLGEGYYVATVGRDEAVIRKYMQAQKAEGKRLDRLEMFKDK